MRQDAKRETGSDEQTAHITTRELAQAKDAVSLLLDELQVPAYVFEVEPRSGSWEVRVDCEAGGVWQSLALPVDPMELIDVVTDSQTHDRLLARWRAALGACATRSG